MSTPLWRLSARTLAGAAIGLVSGFREFKLVDRVSTPGSWRLVVPAEHRLIAALTAGPVTVALQLSLDGGRTWRTTASGPILKRRRARSTDGNAVVELLGATDLYWLRTRLAYPQPATLAPPFNVDAYDIRTGPAETVIKGYVTANVSTAAANAGRRVPGFTVAASTGRGATVTGAGRWQPVGELVAALAEQGGVGLTCRDRVFDVSVPRDLSSSGVTFSVARRNLAAWEWEDAAPSVNHEVVAGGGQGTARVIVEQEDASSVVDWWRVEAFRDRRDTSVVGDLTAQAVADIAAGVSPAGVSADLIDTAGAMWEVDYRLGDRVRVDVDGVRLVDQVREVEFAWTKDGVRVRPTVGFAASTVDLPALFRRLADAEQRLRHLERTQ